MKTRLSPENPFSCSRYAFAYEQLPQRGKVLDYGCYDGWFIAKVRKKKTELKFIGIDKNEEVVCKNPFNVELCSFRHFPLPFGDKTFDCVVLLDVLEHVYNQDELLQELHRVLKIGGVDRNSSKKASFFMVGCWELEVYLSKDP